MFRAQNPPPMLEASALPASVPEAASNGLQERLNGHYDSTMYSPLVDEYYDYSGFHNYGYWTPQTRSQKEASENLVDLLVDFLPCKNGNILDVACGMGASTERLLRQYPPSRVIGINISERQLASCRRRAPGCRFINMDATKLRFADNTFDNILCVEAVFHFDTREKFLREAYRVLKPGGSLSLSDILVRTRHAASLMKHVPIANFVSNVDQYRAVFERVGFENVRIVRARERCWEGFRDHSFAYLWAKVLTGQVPISFLWRTKHGQRWRDWAFKDYLLVSARRPHRLSLRGRDND